MLKLLRFKTNYAQIPLRVFEVLNALKLTFSGQHSITSAFKNIRTYARLGLYVNVAFESLREIVRTGLPPVELHAV